MKSFLVPIMALALGAVPARAGDAAATNAAAPVPVAKDIGEAVEVLQKYGLSFDAAAAQKAAIAALVESADAEGRLLSEGDLTELKEAQRGRLYEVGLRICISNGLPQIAEVLPETAADKAGLRAGEVVQEIDKGDVSQLKLSEINEFLRGPKDKSVLFKVGDTNGVSREVDVKRDPLTAPAIRAAEDLPRDVGYLSLNGFYPGSGKEIIKTLRGWAGAGRSGAVIDLRGADGADLDAVADVAGLFAESGSLLFSFRDRQDQDLKVYKADSGGLLNIPVMVLIDGGTTAAAEALAAVLAGSGRGAMLIGSETSADPMVREAVPLAANGLLYIVTKRLVVADGATYDGREGVKPDLEVAPGVSEAEEYESDVPAGGEQKMSDEEKEDRRLRERVRGDPALRRAVDVLLGLKALNLSGKTNAERAAP